MFAELALAAMAAQSPLIHVPLGKPKQVEQPRAPIEPAGRAFDAVCNDNDDWDKPAPPVRIHANTYLVGTCGISSILITGSDGHILLDSGTEAGADLVIRNIRELGFNPTDVKILLHSHEHIDHVGGMGRLQQLTGAQLFASANAASVFRTGTPGPGDPQAGLHPPFPTAEASRIIRNGEEVRLGNLKLTAIETKGHTHGAMSWQWVSCDVSAICRIMVYADSLSPVSREDYKFTDHPGALKAFRSSIKRIGALECEILMTPHPSASKMLDRMAGRTPILDPNGCKAYADVLDKRLEDRVTKEQAK